MVKTEKSEKSALGDMEHTIFEDHINWETNNSYVNLPRLLCGKPLLAPNPSNLGIWLQNVISLWSVELYRNLYETNL